MKNQNQKIRNQNILIPIQNQNQNKNFYNKISPKKLKKNNSKNYENIKEYFINKNPQKEKLIQKIKNNNKYITSYQDYQDYQEQDYNNTYSPGSEKLHQIKDEYINYLQKQIDENNKNLIKYETRTNEFSKRYKNLIEDNKLLNETLNERTSKLNEIIQENENLRIQLNNNIETENKIKFFYEQKIENYENSLNECNKILKNLENKNKTNNENMNPNINLINIQEELNLIKNQNMIYLNTIKSKDNSIELITKENEKLIQENKEYRSQIEQYIQKITELYNTINQKNNVINLLQQKEPKNEVKINYIQEKFCFNFLRSNCDKEKKNNNTEKINQSIDRLIAENEENKMKIEMLNNKIKDFDNLEKRYIELIKYNNNNNSNKTNTNNNEKCNDENENINKINNEQNKDKNLRYLNLINDKNSVDEIKDNNNKENNITNNNISENDNKLDEKDKNSINEEDQQKELFNDLTNDEGSENFDLKSYKKYKAKEVVDKVEEYDKEKDIALKEKEEEEERRREKEEKERRVREEREEKEREEKERKELEEKERREKERKEREEKERKELEEKERKEREEKERKERERKDREEREEKERKEREEREEKDKKEKEEKDKKEKEVKKETPNYRYSFMYRRRIMKERAEKEKAEKEKAEKEKEEAEKEKEEKEKIKKEEEEKGQHLEEQNKEEENIKKHHIIDEKPKDEKYEIKETIREMNRKKNYTHIPKVKKRFKISDELEITEINTSSPVVPQNLSFSLDSKNILNGNIYLFGIDRNDNFHIFDLKKRHWSKKKILEIEDISDNFNKDYQYEGTILYNTLNGVFLLTGKKIDILYYYNPLNETINKICKFNNSHDNGALMLDKEHNRLFVLGGKNTYSCEYYSFNEKKIFPVPDLNRERANASYIISNNKIYAFFGFSYEKNNYAQSIEFIDNKKLDKWHEINDIKILNKDISFDIESVSTFLMKDNKNKIVIYCGIKGENEDFIEDNYYIFNTEDNSIDLIDKYNSKVMRYTGTRWRNYTLNKKDPTGYHFAKNSNFLELPKEVEIEGYDREDDIDVLIDYKNNVHFINQVKKSVDIFKGNI